MGDTLHFPPEEIRFRCMRQLEPGLYIRGAISLLGEYPLSENYALRELYGTRQPPGHEASFDVSWGVLTHQTFSQYPTSLDIDHLLESAQTSMDLSKNKRRKEEPKPSSKKRFKYFRLHKSNLTTVEIHRQAIERTSVSVDTLLNHLNKLRIFAQKQEIVIPITTRGIGFLTNESFREAEIQCPKSVHDCNLLQTYRVALAQHHLQLDESDVGASLDDPRVEGLRVQNPRFDVVMRQQVASMPYNFNLVTDLINSTGRFDHAQASFRSEVMAPDTGAPVDVATPKRRRVAANLVISDPYSVAFNTLRANVVALSDEATPVVHRQAFIDANPIPGSILRDSLLVNADDIMPVPAVP
ncbi:hypothetical protein PUN28_002089 [Cardiocondyla obscurior]|uniref:Uncharacterized protein n=1 Tax=Cardiocondyla obscurior TaxID=286306 RepID=A0AAW2GSM5_9HYME